MQFLLILSTIWPPIQNVVSIHLFLSFETPTVETFWNLDLHHFFQIYRSQGISSTSNLIQYSFITIQQIKGSLYILTWILGGEYLMVQFGSSDAVAHQVESSECRCLCINFKIFWFFSWNLELLEMEYITVQPPVEKNKMYVWKLVLFITEVPG